MKYEYEITKHPAQAFKSVIYFCSESGNCDLEEIGGDEITKLTDILNERGEKGWKFIQAVFSKDGVLIFWQRKGE